MERTRNMHAEHLRAVAREALEALVLERTKVDEGFALWLDAKLGASVPTAEGLQLDPAPLRRPAEALLSAAGSGRRQRHWDEWGTHVDETSGEGK